MTLLCITLNSLKRKEILLHDIVKISPQKRLTPRVTYNKEDECVWQGRPPCLPNSGVPHFLSGPHCTFARHATNTIAQR